MSKVCILDYGSGNVKSVFNLLTNLADDVVISNSPEQIETASHLVLPGVGAFGAAIQKIHSKIPLELVKKQVFTKKVPFLGICVGMQVLAKVGFEFGESQGLGWIDGKVEKLDSKGLPLPHIGWNSLKVERPHPILENLDSGIDFYFVHSYVFSGVKAVNCLATTHYGVDFPCVVADQNIIGVQFHPEKSQRAGIALAKNFLAIK